MVLTVQIPRRNVDEWKTKLVEDGLFDSKYRFAKDEEFIYLPVLKKFDCDFPFVEKKLVLAQVDHTLRTALQDILTPEEQTFVKTAHDVIGTIAILEIPDALEYKEQQIAVTLLAINPQIKTVLKKAASHEGEFRTQKMTFLAGIDTKETTYFENGAKIFLNVETVYFSIRLSNERKRIANMIKDGEEVLVMFSGCAPYPVVFGKMSDAKTIVGIEINPEGHRYGLQNIKLNKLKNVTLINEDVRLAVPKILDGTYTVPKTYDRIAMPLPKTADEFLDDALVLSKKGTIIHFYDFLPDEEFDDALQKIAVACEKRNLSYKILDVVKCGQHSPKFFRICVDFEIV